VTTSCACGQPVKDQAVICPACTHRLARDLGSLGALADELQTTRTRQSRTGGAATGVLSRSSDKPLPWNEKAAESAELLRTTVVAWVRIVADTRGGRLPDDSVAAMARYLLSHLELLRHHEAAAEAADELGHVSTLAWQTIDRHPGRTYAGPCRESIDPHDEAGEACCVADLYARVGKRTVVCEHCCAEHDTAERRDWLLRVAENQLVPAADLPAILGTPDAPLSLNTVKSWIRRHRLLPHGDYQPALYRVGDATDLLYGQRRTA
jgi:hypothetical protein